MKLSDVGASVAFVRPYACILSLLDTMFYGTCTSKSVRA
jgi:hypothetical protein